MAFLQYIQINFTVYFLFLALKIKQESGITKSILSRVIGVSNDLEHRWISARSLSLF